MELCQCLEAQEENSVCLQLLSIPTSGVPGGTGIWAPPQTPRFCGQVRTLQQGQRCNCSHKVTPVSHCWHLVPLGLTGIAERPAGKQGSVEKA